MTIRQGFPEKGMIQSGLERTLALPSWRRERSKWSCIDKSKEDARCVHRGHGKNQGQHPQLQWLCTAQLRGDQGSRLQCEWCLESCSKGGQTEGTWKQWGRCIEGPWETSLSYHLPFWPKTGIAQQTLVE